MKTFFNCLLVISILTITTIFAPSDVNGLTPCKDSAVFKLGLDGSVKKLSSRLEKYTEGTPAYLALEQQIDQSKARFAEYGEKDLLFGADGLLHLIADGRLDQEIKFINKNLKIVSDISQQLF